jgi:hypothetical protein
MARRNSVSEPVSGSSPGATLGTGAASSKMRPGDSVEHLWSITVMSGIVGSPLVTRSTAAGDLVEVDARTVQFSGGEALRPVRCGVTVVGTPEIVGALEVGDHILVMGSTRRRFFRSGPTTVARMEVAAHRIVPASNRKQWMQAIREVEQWMAQVSVTPPPSKRKAA